MPNRRPSATTEFTLDGVEVKLPAAAAAGAVKNAAKRFERGYGLPSGAAFALAAASVDPASERGRVPADGGLEALDPIMTPSNSVLLCHRARLWTPLVSGDGSNGRSRYELQTTGDASLRPWPVAWHHDPAIVDYRGSSKEDMATAARASAETIRSPKLMTEISQHVRGVWRPPVVVIARAKSSEDSEDVWFLHTIEGSTRIEACHELIEVDAGAPLSMSDSPLEHLRRTRDRLVERFESLPTSPASLAAARAATVPALVVVAVVGEDGVPLVEGFPDVVNDYVESVHVQPRPFSDVAMNNVLGERLLLTLRREGLLDPGDLNHLMGRVRDPEGTPSIRAAELVKLITDSANEKYIREIAITEERGHLTKNRRANLIGPLVARQFPKPAETADRALMRSFTPDALIEKDWTISGDKPGVLRRKALRSFEQGELDDPSILELIARGGPALCAAGLLLSDQGSTVEDKAELRGPVSRVLDGLVESRGGVEVLCDAVSWADGTRRFLPRVRTLNGDVKTDAGGDEHHYVAQWRSGNMQIRALALNGGVIPRTKRNGKEKAPPARTPEEAYEQTELELRTNISSAATKLADLLALKDEQGRLLLGRIGLRPAPEVAKFASRLQTVYARFGTEDPLVGLEEDELPDAEVSLESEEEEA
jgi:hypothetical protein